MPDRPVKAVPESLSDLFGQIDIYLFDQLLKGRLRPSMRVLDAGCGNGRNLVYLARMGCELFAVDSDATSVRAAREHIGSAAPGIDTSKFVVARVESLPFEDAAFDVVICNAVLHFARNEQHFDEIVGELWRVLTPGGLLFTRLASSIGIEGRVRPTGNGRYVQPDGSERFLVDVDKLETTTASLGGRLEDPIKTTNVHGQRCMTTW